MLNNTQLPTYLQAVRPIDLVSPAATSVPDTSTATTSHTMSAPQQGRQSPDPERQGKSQVHEPPATNVNDQGQAPQGTKEAEGGKGQTESLASNPKQVLEDAAEQKTK